jgi:hypothetical protein
MIPTMDSDFRATYFDKFTDLVKHLRLLVLLLYLSLGQSLPLLDRTLPLYSSNGPSKTPCHCPCNGPDPHYQTRDNPVGEQYISL